MSVYSPEESFGVWLFIIFVIVGLIIWVIKVLRNRRLPDNEDLKDALRQKKARIEEEERLVKERIRGWHREIYELIPRVEKICKLFARSMGYSFSYETISTDVPHYHITEHRIMMTGKHYYDPYISVNVNNDRVSFSSGYDKNQVCSEHCYSQHYISSQELSEEKLLQELRDCILRVA